MTATSKWTSEQVLASANLSMETDDELQLVGTDSGIPYRVQIVHLNKPDVLASWNDLKDYQDALRFFAENLMRSVTPDNFCEFCGVPAGEPHVKRPRGQQCPNGRGPSKSSKRRK